MTNSIKWQQLWEEEVQNFKDLCDMIGACRPLNPLMPNTKTWIVPFTKNNLEKLSAFLGDSVKYLQKDSIGASYVHQCGNDESLQKYGLKFSNNRLICFCTE